jgi:hypothetical protein
MNDHTLRQLLFALLLTAGQLSASAFADGSVIGKIYPPYVQPEERELEVIYLHENDNDSQAGDRNILKLGYGQSINEYWFGEISFTLEETEESNAEIDEVELEARWQITEQGEYDYDWGMLFEAERSFENNVNEVAAGIIVAREWGRWMGTANLKLIYEGGSGVEDEFETSLAAQLRYRYTRALEPAIELYSSDESKAIGPVLLGNIKLDGRQQLFWEAGIYRGLERKSADNTFKFILEYEF